jgi:hypothetical protein
MNNSSKVKFSGNIEIKHNNKPNQILFVIGNMEKVNNKISGNYKLKSDKIKKFVNIPFDITGHIDEYGYLNIQTWKSTYIKGILKRNVTILSGLNSNKNVVNWKIEFYNN